MKKIQVGFLMSYDYILLKKSIPAVYTEANEIFIALDQNSNTWSGGKFEVDPEFFDWLKSIDTHHKIVLFKDDFYKSNLNAMENEVRERKMLAEKMGIGNWIIQLDSDEYFLNFKDFVNDLKSKDHFLEQPEKNPVQIAGFYINLYKQLDQGFLYVKEVRNQKFATNYPDYQTGRNTRHRVIYTKHLVLHECLSRTEKEIKTKFENWGHSHQVNFESFIAKWKMVDQNNYKNLQNFFYLEPEKWKNLEFVAGNTISEISKNLKSSNLQPPNTYLWKKNFGQWFKHFFK